MTNYEQAAQRVSLLERLEDLRANGNLSDEEFAAQKERVLEHGAAAGTSEEVEWPHSRGCDPGNFGKPALLIGLIIALVVVAIVGYQWFDRSLPARTGSSDEATMTFEQADASLNSAYRAVLATETGTAGKSLKHQQRAWIARRNASCGKESRNPCATAMTIARTAELRQLASGAT